MFIFSRILVYFYDKIDNYCTLSRHWSGQISYISVFLAHIFLSFISVLNLMKYHVPKHLTLVFLVCSRNIQNRVVFNWICIAATLIIQYRCHPNNKSFRILPIIFVLIWYIVMSFVCWPTSSLGIQASRFLAADSSFEILFKSLESFELIRLCMFIHVSRFIEIPFKSFWNPSNSSSIFG